MEQLTREEFGKIVKILKAVYAHPTFIADQDAFNTWFYLLQDIPYAILQAAVQMHMQSSSFPPTVSDLRAAAAKLVTPSDNDITELEAWAMVRKSICRSGYYSIEEFEKLPPLVRKAVGSHENLKEWSQMPLDTVGSVIQSQFLRSYRQVLQKKEELVKLPYSFQQQLQGSGQKELPEPNGGNDALHRD